MKPKKKEEFHLTMTTPSITLEAYNNRENRFAEKFRALNRLPVTMYFLTLTLNEEGGKDRYKQQTIIDASRRAIKLTHPAYYLMIYEQHKDGAWHAHLIAPILEARNIYNAYTAGYVKMEQVRSSTYNELCKYISKAPKGKRAIYCSTKLNQLIRYQRKTKETNQRKRATLDDHILNGVAE